MSRPIPECQNASESDLTLISPDNPAFWCSWKILGIKKLSMYKNVDKKNLQEWVYYWNRHNILINLRCKFTLLPVVLLVLITALTGSPRSWKTKNILFYIQRKSDMCLKHLIYLYKTRSSTRFWPICHYHTENWFLMG